MNETPFRYPIWTRGDLDGFFGLMVDNLVQVLLIIDLCTHAAGLPAELIYTRILPGVAVSLLIGNLFYGFQAHYVARRDRNAACTALPYGVNTPSVVAYALFIMAPVYQSYRGTLGDQTAATLAWKAGLWACLVSGIIEFVGAFVAERLRRVTPRAALLGVLAAVGVAFIATDFAFRIFTKPLIGMVPLAILLLAYFSRYRFPLGLPGGCLAVVVGTAAAWVLSIPLLAGWYGGDAPMSVAAVRGAWDGIGAILPYFCGRELASVLERPELVLRFLTISVPMGLLNVLASLQNIESAEAGGDRFRTAPSLAVNGVSTVAAALFGSCFPTTIYIGHPGWKALGARAGYSILNGAFFTACFLLGLGPLLRAVIPIEAGAAIVMYIGVVIVAQAFQTTPREHAPAVALSFFPGMAALLIVNLPLFMADTGAARTLAELLNAPAASAAVPVLAGMVTLSGANSGWIVVTLILTAVGTALLDRHYRAAALWCLAASLLTAVGLLHAYRVDGNVVREYFLWQTVEPSPTTAAYRAGTIAVCYALAALLFAGADRRSRTAIVPEPPDVGTPTTPPDAPPA
ncbi:MAG: NCS2 family permease [Planctomycetes bacterium]|nr:NCS2 family permease [Planctomycetota bacterium]